MIIVLCHLIRLNIEWTCQHFHTIRVRMQYKKYLIEVDFVLYFLYLDKHSVTRYFECSRAWSVEDIFLQSLVESEIGDWTSIVVQKEFRKIFICTYLSYFKTMTVALDEVIDPSQPQESHCSCVIFWIPLAYQ